MNAKNTSSKEAKEYVSKRLSGEGNKMDKYLTDMKELPPTPPSDEDLKKVESEKNTKTQHHIPEREESFLGATKSIEPALKEEKKSIIPQESSRPINLDEQEQTGKRYPFTSKDVILGIINLISIILFVVILLRFPERSKELKELKIQGIRSNSNINLELNEIEASKPQAEKLKALFLDESGVVNFVNDIESQKTEGGAIRKVTFASQKAVKDRTGNFGIPIVIELTGSWPAIDADLQKIGVLNYLYRPASIKIGYDDMDPTVVEFKYGVFLYVRESLGQSR